MIGAEDGAAICQRHFDAVAELRALSKRQKGGQARVCKAPEADDDAQFGKQVDLTLEIRKTIVAFLDRWLVGRRWTADGGRVRSFP